MNARLYDPRLHRFLQPDNNLQEPYNTQNYNRYGYVLNNPLKYTDPSGEFIWSDLVSGLAIVAGAILVTVGGPAGVLLGYKLIGAGVTHFGATATRLANNGGTWDEASNYVGFNSPTIEIPTNLGGGGKKDVANNNNPVESHPQVAASGTTTNSSATSDFMNGFGKMAIQGALDSSNLMFPGFEGVYEFLGGKKYLNLTPSKSEKAGYYTAMAMTFLTPGGAESGAERIAIKGLTNIAELSSLTATHYITKSKSVMKELVSLIKSDGFIKESIKYVEVNGTKYIVDGHHRYFAAKKLGIVNIPIQEVQLPFRGYNVFQDLLIEGKQAGWWQYFTP